MNWFAVSLVFGFVALFGSATADQRDARLVKLFERLHRSEDIREIALAFGYMVDLDRVRRRRIECFDV